MTLRSNYWRLVSVDGTGQSKTQELLPLKTYFQQQCQVLGFTLDTPDTEIQRQFFSRAHQDATALSAVVNHPASLCLRCFISHQIRQSCSQLVAKFGPDHGFQREDLLPYVLQDQITLRGDAKVENIEEPWPVEDSVITASPKALGLEILQTFDPDRGSLANWTHRRLRQNRDVTQFLLEHGLYLISDWAILNDTSVVQLGRIFAEFHQVPLFQIQQFQELLAQYHRWYREVQWQRRQAGSRGPCPRPTGQQLDQIAQHLTLQGQVSGTQVLFQLQDLADRLRQYRIYVRGGRVSQESLDDPALPLQVDQIPAPVADDLEQVQQEFLTIYQQQFLQALDQAIAQVIQQRLAQLRRKQPQQVRPFLEGLELVHCQGVAMAEVAPQICLTAQYQVTRLLKLKSLRADVRRAMLGSLLQTVLQTATAYATPENVVALDRHIAVALNEQVSGLIAAAELEGSRPRGQPLTNVFARRLCEYLQTLKPFEGLV